MVFALSFVSFRVCSNVDKRPYELRERKRGGGGQNEPNECAAIGGAVVMINNRPTQPNNEKIKNNFKKENKASE